MVYFVCVCCQASAAVSFSVDAVVAGDRVGALADRPGEGTSTPGLREMLSQLLIGAALDGDLAVVRRLVTCQYVHVDVADRHGNTSLHCAAVSHAHTPVVLDRVAGELIRLVVPVCVRPIVRVRVCVSVCFGRSPV